MGITNLKKLIANCAVRRHLSSYGNKRLGVDASIWLYKFLYRDDKHAIIEGILKQIRQFHRYHITPVYVFDGKASSEVKLVVEKRQQQRQRVKDTLDTLGVELEETLESLGDPVSAALVMDEIDTAPVGNIKFDSEIMPFTQMDVPLFIGDSDDEEFRGSEQIESNPILESEELMLKVVRIQSRMLSLQKQVRRPTREAVEECKQLFELLGVPYRQSPGESDVTLAEMFLHGEVQGIMSEDTDMLPYGCECFITGFVDSNDFVTEFRLSDCLKELKMTREQFVDLCILCGCDYAEKIYKIALKTAFSMIHKYGNIEGILTHIQSSKALIDRHPYPEDFMTQVQRARNMFLTRRPETEEPDKLYIPGSEAVWNFDAAIALEKDFHAFLTDHDFNVSQYAGLCKSWPQALPKTQKTMFDFYKK